MRCCVFYSGTHTDRFGRKNHWPVDRVRQIKQLYDNRKRDSPAVIGHPKLDEPAVGWISNLEEVPDYPRAGELALFATFSNVDPEFAEAVKQRRYWDRSLAFRSDLSIRHCGFFGATAGALSELGGVEFAESDGEAYELAELGEIEFAELTANNPSQTEGLSMTPEQIAALAEAIATALKPTLDAISEKVDAIAASAKGDASGNTAGGNGAEGGSGSEHSETEETVNSAVTAALNQANARIAELEQNALRMEFSEFVCSEEMKQRIAPGLRYQHINTLMSLSKLEGKDYEFSEAGTVKKGTAVEQYKATLKALPKIAPEFSELATDGTSTDGTPPSHVANASRIVHAGKKATGAGAKA